MMNYRKFPVIKDIYNKINAKFDRFEKEIAEVCQENLDLRFQLKSLKKEKINVVFVCHRPAVWGSVKTVYEAMKKDNSFNVKIVTIPNKKQLPKLGLEHEVYQSEGAEDFWKGDDVIAGYNYETGEWLDLKSLHPDYVCFLQPYNSCKPAAYKSWNVSKFAKLFYVEYGYNTVKDLGIECLPADFIRNVSLFFLQNETEKVWYKDYFANIDNSFTNCFITGFPRFDFLDKYAHCESDVWKCPHESHFRIIWTPRWCTNENNCHFFAYKDKLVDFCSQKDDIEFLFRPHPQAFINWQSTGEFSKAEADKYISIYEKSNNLGIDNTKEYLKTFYSSDCLVTDYSSIVPEYFLTGKPVIYCKNENAIYNTEGKFTEGFYIVHNWSELQDTILMLKNNEDPLKEKRQNLIKSEFLISKEGAGYNIKELIKQDFNK